MSAATNGVLASIRLATKATLRASLSSFAISSVAPMRLGMLQRFTKLRPITALACLNLNERLGKQPITRPHEADDCLLLGFKPQAAASLFGGAHPAIGDVARHVCSFPPQQTLSWI